MDPANRIKSDIIAKYDEEAAEMDNAAWLASGGDVRVPESPASLYFVERKVSEALKLCGPQVSPQSEALEIGCSFGHMTPLLARRVKHLTAVDISPQSIAIAERRLKHYGVTNVSFAVQDAETLAGLPDEAFDVVFSFSTIRFCPNPQAVMGAICRKLRPGGVAVIDFPNRRSPWHGVVKRLLGIQPHVHDRLYNRAETVRLFEDAGLRVEGVKLFLFTTRRLPTVLLPLFQGVDLVFERLGPLRNLAGIIMVKGVKDR